MGTEEEFSSAAPLGPGGWSAKRLVFGSIILEGVVVHDATSNRALSKFLRTAQRAPASPAGGGSAATPQLPSLPAAAAPWAAKSERRLSVAMETYLSDLKKRGVKGRTPVRLALRQLMVATGDISVAEITDEHIRKFEDVWRWWPGRLSQNARYRDLTDEELYALGRENNVPEPARATHKTVMSTLKAFFNQLVSARVISYSPLDGFKNDRPNYTETDARRALTFDEIKRIFDPRTYARWSAKYPHRFWGPLIGLHTGARVSEVGQMRVSDVVQDGDIWCFKFRASADNDRLGGGASTASGSMKTEASIRTVPIHPTLLDLGLLDYLEDARASGHKRLFPNLPSGSIGNPDAESPVGYGAALSTQFSHYLKKVIALEKGMGFHAFRHTMATNLEDNGVASRLIASISGHGNAARQREYEADLAVMRKTYCHQSTPAFREMQFAALMKFEPSIKLARYQRGQFAWAFGPDARRYV